ncbi:MAG: PAS domain-containing protein [Prochlorococcaceae cyanobacterium]|jgi:PAS domain S-box-containing protein
MPSLSPALPPIRSDDGRRLWTLFVCGASAHSSAALAAVRDHCERLLPDRVDLRIHDIRSDPAAAMAAGVLAVPSLVGSLPPLPGQAATGQASPGQASTDRADLSALQLRIDQLEATLAAIMSGTADALLIGASDPAGGSARFFLPVGADDPYRAIVEQMGEGVGILSATGLLLYANPRLVELLNRPRETLLGRPLAELIPPAQRTCLERLRKVSPGRSEQAELELMPHSGESVQVLATVSGLQGTGIGTQCVILTNLSGLQAPGVKCAGDDHRYRLLQNTSTAFVVETDEHRRVRWASPSVHAVLGWLPQDLLGGCLTDLLHPEETLEGEPPQGQKQPLLRLRGSDGTYHWMRFFSWPIEGEGRSPERWIISFQDISELVALQDERVIDQARLAAVLMSSSGPQIILDVVRPSDGGAPDFVCAAANDAACRRYGLNRDELVGLRLLQALPAHAAVGLVALCNRALDSDRSMTWGELDEPSGTHAEERRHHIRVDRVGDVLSCSWGEQVARNSGVPTLQSHQQASGLVEHAELLGQLSRQQIPSHRRTQPLALVLCHLHNLGKIHEEQGAESADRLIQILEERLHQILPKNIILARVKVDQLLVVLWDMNNRAQAEAMAESIRGVMALPVHNQGTLIRMATSVTVALEQPGSCMEDLISSAMEEWSDPSCRCRAVSR